MGVHRRFRTYDCLQLVRLRPAAASGHHQFPHQLRTHRRGALMSLLAFFQWCYATPLGETIRDSAWLFPVIEAVHLLGFVLTLSAVLIVELRLLGSGLNRRPVAHLASRSQPWLLTGVTLLFSSGRPSFL